LAGVGVDNRRRSHAGDLVGGDRHPHPGAADEDPAIEIPAGDALGDRLREIGVIHRLSARRAEVFVRDAHLVEELLQRVFEL
jgi:hypothetical protein